MPIGISYLLRRCDFVEKWRSWIAHCISSMWFSAMVNGNPSGFFYSSHSLRQGDSLSSFLFVIVMEALSRMLSATFNGGFLSCFSVGFRHFDLVNILYLLFADDTFCFFVRLSLTTFVICVLYFYASKLS
jgi:hypothetical protein